MLLAGKFRHGDGWIIFVTCRLGYEKARIEMTRSGRWEGAGECMEGCSVIALGRR